ncbi:MAG: 2-oxoacid:ferredoxin oxidoreductase subunit alpha [Helicobacteraceae bacterium]|jgi:pyruvate ferredoxin oxidoreductase alpha subunit|nr:2-oxoacid:ferredoxin oxidoreductase subunit alpha [Helicobacteraceae bacterium]
MTQEKVVWDGNTAAAQAMRQAQIDVVAAYPITPSTPIVQRYSQFVADGDVKGEFVMVESEHSAMSACVGAAAAGGRVATATSSQGYALMIEVLYQASGMRLPIVLNVVNRALAAPLNIHGDHADMYLGRDAGWINLCAFNPQEVYDLNFIAFKTAEDLRVRLPVAVNQDGFLTSHTTELVLSIDDQSAYGFIGDYKPLNPMLDLERPVTYGAQTEGEWHYEHKMRHNHAIVESQKVVEENFAAFEKLTGRKYKSVETYKAEDADEIIIAIGSVTGTTMLTIDELRKSGRKVGLVAIRLFRPFPKAELAAAIKKAKTIAALDRSAPMGTTGALYSETAAVMVENGINAILLNYIYGIGGRDTTIEHLQGIFNDAAECTKAGKRVKPIMQTINLRGKPLSFYP